jgi:predicted aspartyl protease
VNGFDLIIQPDAEDAEAANIFVDGAIGGKPYRFLLDTGAATSTIVLDDYTATFEPSGKRQDSGLFSTRTADQVTAPEIRLGPII